VDVNKLHTAGRAESSEQIRNRVMKARRMQQERFCESSKQFNGDMDTEDIKKYCVLGETEKKYMEQIYTSLKLSARAYHRILKVARTIADLAEEERISTEHLLEAACYRPASEYWG